MPLVPLIDPSQYDLSRVVTTKDQLYSTLTQSGRFAMADGLLHLDTSGEIVIGFKEIRSDDWWCEDHIPGRPLFPGALMLETSAQISTYDFLQRRPELDKAFIGFSGIDKTRFRAPVEPDCRLLFVCFAKRLRKAMFTYNVQGLVDDNIVFETTISGMVVSGG